tara:strand:- start:1004 stop:1441 length:438 start_codon:yes stop_codon:yes gene_type:complete
MQILTYDKKIIDYPNNLICYSVFLSNLPNHNETIELNNKACRLIILKEIIQFLNKHNDFKNNNVDTDCIIRWNNKFFDLTDDILFQIIEASNFLDINNLFELACNEVANIVKKCNTANNVRKRFNIKDDITPEEKAEIYKFASNL